MLTRNISIFYKFILIMLIFTLNHSSASYFPLQDFKDENEATGLQSAIQHLKKLNNRPLCISSDGKKDEAENAIPSSNCENRNKYKRFAEAIKNKTTLLGIIRDFEIHYNSDFIDLWTTAKRYGYITSEDAFHLRARPAKASPFGEYVQSRGFLEFLSLDELITESNKERNNSSVKERNNSSVYRKDKIKDHLKIHSPSYITYKKTFNIQVNILQNSQIYLPLSLQLLEKELAKPFDPEEKVSQTYQNAVQDFKDDLFKECRNNYLEK